MLAKSIISLVVFGLFWLGTAWWSSRARWAALSSFPGGRRRLFAAEVLTWFPWFAAMVAVSVMREAFDPDDRMGMWSIMGLALVGALVVGGASLLATHLFPPTRRLRRDLREAGRAARAGGG